MGLALSARALSQFDCPTPLHVANSLAQPAFFHFTPEVGQRGFEDHVVVVVHRHHDRRRQQVEQLRALPAVHGDHQPTRKGGPSQVEHPGVDVRKPPWNVLQVIDDQRVPRNVDP